MGKMACYNALKPPGGRCSDGKKRVRGRREPPDAEGDQLRGVRGVLRIKSKIGAGGSHFGLPAPSAVCFTQIKGYSDFAMMTCIALGVFLSDRRHASGDCLCKEPCCFFFVGAADENFAAVDEMEGIAHKRKYFRGVYPKALVAVDKGMSLQSGQKFLGSLSAEHRIVKLDYLCLMSCPLQI